MIIGPPPKFHGTRDILRDHQRLDWTPAFRCATRRSSPGTRTDPRTTEHYDRARGNLDRHGVHFSPPT